MAIGTTVFRSIQSDYIVQQNHGAVTIGAHSEDPGDDGTVGEVSGGSYARAAAPSWALDPDTARKRVALAEDVDITGMPAATITHLSVWVGSQFYCSIPASTARTVAAGNTLRILAGTAITDG